MPAEPLEPGTSRRQPTSKPVRRGTAALYDAPTRVGRESMGLTLRVHFLAAGLALVFGCVALYAAKGATLHRKSGMLFVYAMLTMSLTGAVMAASMRNLRHVVA